MSQKFGLTQKQKAMLDFIAAHIAEHGFSPSHREMVEAGKAASLASTNGMVDSLEKRGYIRRIRGAPRSIQLVKGDTNE